jgi:hypothetical protein
MAFHTSQPPQAVYKAMNNWMLIRIEYFTHDQPSLTFKIFQKIMFGREAGTTRLLEECTSLDHAKELLTSLAMYANTRPEQHRPEVVHRTDGLMVEFWNESGSAAVMKFWVKDHVYGEDN